MKHTHTLLIIQISHHVYTILALRDNVYKRESSDLDRMLLNIQILPSLPAENEWTASP